MPRAVMREDEAAAIRAEIAGYVRRRVANAAQQEDIVQEVMARLARLLREDSVDRPRALALRIAERVVIDFYRMQARRRIEPIDESLRSADPSPEDAAIARDRVARLQAAIRAMPSLRRDVFLRRRVHGHSCARIAADLKLTPRAVEAHVARALKDLAALIEESRSG